MADQLPPLPPPPGPPPGLAVPQAGAVAAAPQYASHEAYAQAYAAYYGTQPLPQPAGALGVSPGVAAPSQPVSAAAQGYDYSAYYHAQGYPNYNYNAYYGYPPGSQPQAAGAPGPWTGGAAAAPAVAAPPQSFPQQKQQQSQSRPSGVAPPPGLIRVPGRSYHQFRPPASASPSNPLLTAAQAAAAAISAGKPPPRPAYVSVDTGGGAGRGAGGRGGRGRGRLGAAALSLPPQLNPKDWPPAVKAFVERAFKIAPTKQRAKLQDVLRALIADAQQKGELWTRSWESLPLPDLTLSTQDATSVVLEAAAMMGPAGAQPQQQGWGAAAASHISPRDNSSSSPWAASTSYVGRGGRGGGRHRGSAVGMVSTDTNKKRQRWSSAEAWSDSESDASQGGGFADDEEIRRARRAGRFKDGAAEGAGPKPGSQKARKHAQSRRAKLSALLDDAGAGGEDVDWDAFAIQGTCQTLEKSYFRLTSAPHPSTVRPEAVLRRALDRLLRLIATGEVNYFYAQDQFKGMRQDCVVQALRGPLAMAVYEAHARAALAYGDLAEYNQCQGQMAALQADGVCSEGGCGPEFLALRLLYLTVHAQHGEQLALLNTLRTVGDAEAKEPEVAHALRVRAAVASADYASFFRLYASAPKLGRALLDLAVPRLRFAALNAFVKAFKPSLAVEFLARLLGFVADENSLSSSSSLLDDGRRGGGGGKGKGKGRGGVAVVVAKSPLAGCATAVFEGAYAAKSAAPGLRDCLEWLAECGAAVTGSGAETAVDCKASTGQLRMPEEKEKVAHGDVNLDIGDFLKSFDEG